MGMGYQHHEHGVAIGGAAGGDFTPQPGRYLEALPLEASTPWEGVEPHTYSLQPVRAQHKRKRKCEQSTITSLRASASVGGAGSSKA